MGSLPSSDDSRKSVSNMKDENSKSVDPSGIRKSSNIKKMESNPEDDEDSDDVPDMPLMTGEQLDQSIEVVNSIVGTSVNFQSSTTFLLSI